MAHVMGTIPGVRDPGDPAVSTNWTVTIVSIVIIVAFHIFITSTFPLAVPWSGTSSASSRWRSSPGTPMRTVSGSSTSASVDAAGVPGRPPDLPGDRQFPARSDLLPCPRCANTRATKARWTCGPGAEEKLKRAGLPSSVGLHSEQIRASGAPEDHQDHGRDVRRMAVVAHPGPRPDVGAARLSRGRPGLPRDLGGRDRCQPASRLELWRRALAQPPLPGDSARVLRIRARRVRRGLGRVPAAPQTDPGGSCSTALSASWSATRGTSTIVLRRNPGCPTVRSR